MTATKIPLGPSVAHDVAPSGSKRATPVKWWASLGAFCIALQLYIFIHWFASGQAKTTQTGPTPVPEWMKVSIVVQEIASIAGLLVCLYIFFIRPWRRDRQLSFDAMFMVAVGLTWWQDPMYNYSQAWTTYNASGVNLGSWATSIPGWSSPHGNLLADPLLWSGPAYIWAMFIGCVIANKVVDRARLRWPQLGAAGVIGVNYLFYLVMCFAIEAIWLRLGVYTYAGAIPSLTLWHGHYYQLPIYETFLYALYWGGWALVRYFRNDRGQTIAERGIERLGVSGRRRSWIRFLSLVGVLNVVLLSGIVIAQFFGLHAGAWPKDVTDRSYLTDGLCGPGTTYACPGPKVPIARIHSVHVTPSGGSAQP